MTEAEQAEAIERILAQPQFADRRDDGEQSLTFDILGQGQTPEVGALNNQRGCEATEHTRGGGYKYNVL